MTALNKLSARFVKTAPTGKYSDGGGLWLHKRPDGGAQWFLRVTVHKRRREMGLGSLSEVSLREARELAAKWRGVVREGKDPIKERQRLRRIAANTEHTLAAVAEAAFEAKKAELRGDGKAGRWFSPLELHVLPKIGRVPVQEIDQQDIKNALAPIWHEKADTARKAMNRLNIVLRHAAAMGLEVDIQAPEKARALLGRQRHQTQHISAMAWQKVPAFYASLDEGSVTHLALRLLILTAARSKPVRFLHEDQIEGDIWTIPADNMKGRRDQTSDFRVPLSAEAQAMINEARKFARDGFLFPGARQGVISDATMSRLMGRQELEARPHGFRTSFRTWCAEATDTPHEVAETVLSHSIGTKVVRSYRRTDFLEKRRILMERWAGHVLGESGVLLSIRQS